MILQVNLALMRQCDINHQKGKMEKQLQVEEFEWHKVR